MLAISAGMLMLIGSPRQVENESEGLDPGKNCIEHTAGFYDAYVFIPGTITSYLASKLLSAPIALMTNSTFNILITFATALYETGVVCWAVVCSALRRQFRSRTPSRRVGIILKTWVCKKTVGYWLPQGKRVT